jgi:hypothetical protein
MTEHAVVIAGGGPRADAAYRCLPEPPGVLPSLSATKEEGTDRGR